MQKNASELYRVKTFDKLTFRGSEKTFKNKKRAIKRFEELKARDEPAYLLVLLRSSPMFTTWGTVKDEQGKDYYYGDWKQYLYHK
jgi:hypothetical protein